jgi:hypothetical protein
MRNSLRLTPAEFADEWGAYALVRTPNALPNPPIPTDAFGFLVEAGLPALIHVLPDYIDTKITFCRLESGLSPVTNERTVGPPLPSDWSIYWVIGDEFFCNGSAFWCIDQRDGQIVRIDIELDDPIDFVNSSVECLARTLVAATKWSAQDDRKSAESPRGVGQLEFELNLIDPRAINSRDSFWLPILNFVRDEKPSGNIFATGSTVEGQRAWKARAW